MTGRILNERIARCRSCWYVPIRFIIGFLLYFDGEDKTEVLRVWFAIRSGVFLRGGREKGVFELEESLQTIFHDLFFYLRKNDENRKDEKK